MISASSQYNVGFQILLLLYAAGVFVVATQAKLHRKARWLDVLTVDRFFPQAQGQMELNQAAQHS